MNQKNKWKINIKSKVRQIYKVPVRQSSEHQTEISKNKNKNLEVHSYNMPLTYHRWNLKLLRRCGMPKTYQSNVLIAKARII